MHLTAPFKSGRTKSDKKCVRRDSTRRDEPRRSPTASAFAAAPHSPVSSETTKNATTSGRRSKLERTGTDCFGPGAVAATTPTRSAAGLHAPRRDAVSLTTPPAKRCLSRQRQVRRIVFLRLRGLEGKSCSASSSWPVREEVVLSSPSVW
ncbi:hypothetical protein BKA80DRAFT_280864 [Phyllosticta citrichinensis]